MPAITQDAPSSDHAIEQPTPVVCVGLSAGGVQPLETIFRRLNPDTGMAYVIIPHLARKLPTVLPALLGRWSGMACELARTGVTLAPNHIYVIPPGQEITVTDGTFAVQPRSKVSGYSNVITLFLNSLLRARKPAGVAVILSGFDSDGAAALRSFWEEGGITIVQDLKSAHFKDMPQAAIDTGCVDYVLPPKEIAPKIELIAKSFPIQPEDHPPDDTRPAGGAE